MTDHIPDASKEVCPACGADLVSYMEFACGSYWESCDSTLMVSHKCLRTQLEQVRAERDELNYTVERQYTVLCGVLDDNDNGVIALEPDRLAEVEIAVTLKEENNE